MNNNDWKQKLGVVYSTNPNFSLDTENEDSQSSLPKNKQLLRIEIDKKGRNGKCATLITGYVGSESDVKELAKMLKIKCGVGGSTRDGEILIQGDVRTKVADILVQEGYKTKVIKG